MPIVRGIQDEVVYAALAAAAAPLAISLSTSSFRKQQLSLLQTGASSASRILHLLWVKLRLWLLRRARSVLKALGDSRKQQPSVRHGPSCKELPPCGGEPSEARLCEGEQHAPFSREMEPEEKVESGEASIRGIFGRRHRDGGSSREKTAEASSLSDLSAGEKQPPAGEICSVCHDEFTLPCRASCGHWFCAECITRVWHHGSALSSCSCPICRRSISLLCLEEGRSAKTSAAALRFSPTSTVSSRCSSRYPGLSDKGPSLAKRMELMQTVAEYNRLFGGVPVSLWQRVLDMPLLLRRWAKELLDPTKVLSLLHSIRFVFYVFGTGVYMLSPLDMFPQGMKNALGAADDAVLIICVAFYLTILGGTMWTPRAPRGSDASRSQEATDDSAQHTDS